METKWEKINAPDFNSRRRCGDMIGDEWTGSKDSPNFMTLTFNSKFVQDRVPEKGFRLRFNAVGRGIVVSCIR